MCKIFGDSTANRIIVSAEPKKAYFGNKKNRLGVVGVGARPPPPAPPTIINRAFLTDSTGGFQGIRLQIGHFHQILLYFQDGVFPLDDLLCRGLEIESHNKQNLHAAVTAVAVALLSMFFLGINQFLLQLRALFKYYSKVQVFRIVLIPI